MCNKIKDLYLYFFNNIINVKKFDPNNIKIDENWYKNILIYYIGHVTLKDLTKYVKTNSLNLLYLIINKVNGYISENKKLVEISI